MNNQGNEQYLSEDNYEGPKEQNDSEQEEKEIQKTDEKLEDSLEIQQQEEKSSITESDDIGKSTDSRKCILRRAKVRIPR